MHGWQGNSDGESKGHRRMIDISNLGDPYVWKRQASVQMCKRMHNNGCIFAMPNLDKA